MANAIRPLTLQQRFKPAQLSFHGGFRNVSFQIGEILLPESSQQNINATTASFVRGILKKSPQVQFPVTIPNSLTLMRGVNNIVATVVGQKNPHGGTDAVLIARAIERLSSFNTKLRTVEHLIATKAHNDAESSSDDESVRLGKSSNSRSHNQIMLAGVVVGVKFEEGANPRFHILLRQDANPNNIIPLCYEAKNASALSQRVKFGSIIYVDGEFVYRPTPIYEMDENGKRKIGENGQPIAVLDENGKPQHRIHTYIRVTSPKDPAEFDLDFGNNSTPAWMTEIANQLTAARTRSVQKADAETKPVNPPGSADPRKTIFAGIPGSVDEL